MQKIRDTTIDFLKGSAILTMILSHALYFFYNGSNAVLVAAAKLSNTFSFTAFLFAMGASSYIVRKNSYGSKQSEIVSRTLRRFTILLAGYYTVAFTSYISEQVHTSLYESIRHITEILLFIRVPSFTEFLLPFLFFVFLAPILLLGIFRSFKKPAYALAVTIGSLLLGYFLYGLHLVYPWSNLKAIFAGNEGLLRFPILQYAPVFILGFLWKRYMLTISSRLRHFTLSVSASVFFGIIAISGYILQYIYPSPVLNPSMRWPPSIGFISLGLAGVFMVKALGYLVKNMQLIQPLSAWIQFTGRRPFDFYIGHILLLFMYKIMVNRQFSDPVSVLCLYIVLLFLSAILTIFSLERPALALRSLVSIHERHTRIKKRHLILFLVACFVSLVPPILNKSSSPYGDSMKVNIITPVSEIIIKPISLKTNRTWFLVGTKTAADSILQFSVDTGENTTLLPQLSGQFTYTYEIKNTDIKGTLNPKKQIIEKTIDLSGIPSGLYTLEVIKQLPGNITVSGASKYLIVSKPVYVAWTLDWEGDTVPESTLKNIDTLSMKHYAIPFTQFFHPMVWLTSNAQVDALTRWLTNRQLLSRDEISLHIHAQFDFIRAAGVVTKTTPRWGYKNADGYDVLLTAYSKDELEKILSFSIQEFEKNGFGKPPGFRAGGWFADENTLSVLSKLGFLYDTSGRDHVMWNGSYTSPWNLNSRSQPYFPSIWDQNKSSTDNLTIFEIPNNGGNTYESDSTALLARYRDNFSGDPVNAPVSIVFTSHPKWAGTEFPKAENVLSQIDQYLFVRDMGPVIYTTVSRIYSAWND